MLQPIILCGGSGTRLWPLSRKMYPKQFIALHAMASGNAPLLLVLPADHVIKDVAWGDENPWISLLKFRATFVPHTRGEGRGTRVE